MPMAPVQPGSPTITRLGSAGVTLANTVKSGCGEVLCTATITVPPMDGVLGLKLTVRVGTPPVVQLWAVTMTSLTCCPTEERDREKGRQ